MQKAACLPHFQTINYLSPWETTTLSWLSFANVPSALLVPATSYCRDVKLLAELTSGVLPLTLRLALESAAPPADHKKASFCAQRHSCFFPNTDWLGLQKMRVKSACLTLTSVSTYPIYTLYMLYTHFIYRALYILGDPSAIWHGRTSTMTQLT